MIIWVWSFLLACTSTTNVEQTVDSPFESSKSCQECHPTHYEEWSQSMHAYAAKSPVFDAMAQKAYRDSSGQVGTFCTGCHSPMGEALGESGAMTRHDRSELGLEGVGCDYCHTSVSHDGIVGNNRLEHMPGNIKFGPFSDVNSDTHGGQYSDFVQSPELCGSCHDVFAYPGILIEQAYSEYVDSPSFLQGQRCQDCHMSPNPGVDTDRDWGPIAVSPDKEYPDRPLSSHLFVGPDYSLVDDFPFPDDLDASHEAQIRQIERIDTLLKNAADLVDLSVQRTTTGILAEVGVRNKTAGHRVPTGFTSERQLWVHIEMYDSIGNLFFQSGALDANGDLYDAHSDFVREGIFSEDDYLVNFQSKNWSNVRKHRENGGLVADEGDRHQVEMIFPFDADTVERNSLNPLETRQISYAVQTNAPGPYRVRVRLKYRNLPPYMLRALGLADLVEKLLVFTLDDKETVLQ